MLLFRFSVFFLLEKSHQLGLVANFIEGISTGDVLTVAWPPDGDSLSLFPDVFHVWVKVTVSASASKLPLILSLSHKTTEWFDSRCMRQGSFGSLNSWVERRMKSVKEKRWKGVVIQHQKKVQHSLSVPADMRALLLTATFGILPWVKKRINNSQIWGKKAVGRGCRFRYCLCPWLEQPTILGITIHIGWFCTSHVHPAPILSGNQWVGGNPVTQKLCLYINKLFSQLCDSRTW